MIVEFSKMHGLGNDFVVIDLVTQNMPINRALVQALADRHTGIGFDQLLLVEPPSDPEADFDYRIFNKDGTEVAQCGNGARCFMAFVHARKLTAKTRIVARTKAGLLTLSIDQHGWVQVDMGKPKFAPEDIPFLPKSITKVQDSYRLNIDGQAVPIYVVNVGNPHAVVLVDNVLDADVQKLGAKIGAHEAFGEGVNVGFVEIVHQRHVRLRVFERGVGETAACGSGACAAVAVGVMQNWLDAGVAVRAQMYGGSLSVRYKMGYSVLMAGPATFVYDGVFSPIGIARNGGFELARMDADLLL